MDGEDNDRREGNGVKKNEKYLIMDDEERDDDDDDIDVNER